MAQTAGRVLGRRAGALHQAGRHHLRQVYSMTFLHKCAFRRARQEVVTWKGQLFFEEKPETEPPVLPGSLVAFSRNGELQGVAFRRAEFIPRTAACGQCRQMQGGAADRLCRAIVQEYPGGHVLPRGLAVHPAGADGGRHGHLQLRCVASPLPLPSPGAAHICFSKVHRPRFHHEEQGTL